MSIYIYESIRHRAVQSKLNGCGEDHVPSFDLDSDLIYCPSRNGKSATATRMKKIFISKKLAVTNGTGISHRPLPVTREQ